MGATQATLGKEMQDAVSDVLRQLADTLAGRVYSPRIKLLDTKQVCEASGLSESGLYKLIDRGEFPKPKKLGAKNVWPESMLVAFVERLPEAD